MAAVQATPAMQQQGSHAGGMVNSALPHGMTKEQVQQIYKVCLTCRPFTELITTCC